MRLNDRFVVQMVGDKAVLIDQSVGSEELLSLADRSLVDEIVAGITGPGEEWVRVGGIELPADQTVLARLLYALGYFTGVLNA